MKFSKYSILFLFLLLPFIAIGQSKSKGKKKKKDKFDFRFGLNYAVNNFEENCLNCNYIFPNFENKGRIGILFRPEYRINKFLSISTGVEVIGYKISFDQTIFSSESAFQLHNHRLKIFESHIPIEINYRQKIKKGNYLYFGAGMAGRFILRSKGRIENLSNSDILKDRIDFRVRYTKFPLNISMREFRFNLGYERKMNKKISSFIEVGYRNIPFNYFYGGGTKTWGNDIVINNNSFINLSIGIKI